MADKIAAIEKKYKAQQAKAKRFTIANGEKLKKQVITTVEAVWDAEDAFVDALEAAKGRGMTGSKPADFLKDKDCATTLAMFKKLASKHEKDAKSLAQFSDGARTYVTAFTKISLEAEKELKPIKDKKSPQYKKVAALVAEIKKDAEEQKKVSEIPGTMTMPQLQYGKNFTRVLDRIMKKSKGGPVSLDKLLEKDEVTRNLRSVKKWATQGLKLCDSATKKKDSDKKAATTDLKKGVVVLKKVEKMQKDYSAALKKHAKMLKESKDPETPKIRKQIEELTKLCEAALKKRDLTVKAVMAK